jgi:hypothetical protein
MNRKQKGLKLQKFDHNKPKIIQISKMSQKIVIVNSEFVKLIKEFVSISQNNQSLMKIWKGLNPHTVKLNGISITNNTCLFEFIEESQKIIDNYDIPSQVFVKWGSLLTVVQCTFEGICNGIVEHYPQGIPDTHIELKQIVDLMENLNKQIKIRNEIVSPKPIDTLFFN